MDRSTPYLLSGLAFSILLITAHLLLSQAEFYGNLLDILSTLSAAFAALALYRAHAASMRSSQPWVSFFYLALAMAMWTLAEGIWSFYEIVLGIDAPSASPADFFWLAGYVPFLYSLYLGFERAVPAAKTATAALLVFLVVGAGSFLYTKDIVAASDASLEENLINAGYVLGDTLLLSMMAALLISFLGGREFQPILLIFGFSLLLLAAGDIWYLRLAAYEEYTPSHPVTLFYVVSYVWLGIAGLMYAASGGKISRHLPRP
ncbi:MAG: hypothetical protein AB1529_07315 [Candidatus Micrarchaeota archaeon]